MRLLMIDSRLVFVTALFKLFFPPLNSVHLVFVCFFILAVAVIVVVFIVTLWLFEVPSMCHILRQFTTSRSLLLAFFVVVVLLLLLLLVCCCFIVIFLCYIDAYQYHQNVYLMYMHSNCWSRNLIVFISKIIKIKIFSVLNVC